MNDKQDNNSDSFTGNTEIEENDYKRGEHPNSQSNLAPFPKGVSGNPLGRPTKLENLKRILDQYGNEPSEFMNFEDKTRREAVWTQIWKEAMRGDLRFIQFLATLGCLDEPK